MPTNHNIVAYVLVHTHTHTHTRTHTHTYIHTHKRNILTHNIRKLTHPCMTLNIHGHMNNDAHTQRT